MKEVYELSAIFPNGEYLARYQRAKSLMEKHNIDALLITGDENYTYFSGYQTWARNDSYSRPTFVLLPREHDPVIISHSNYAEALPKISWIGDIRVHNQMGWAPTELIMEVLKECGLGQATIGMELGSDVRLGMPVVDYLKLQKIMPDADFVDGTEIVWKLRMIKSPAELECIRESCRITSESYESFFRKIKEGMSELEAASILRTCMVERGAENPRIYCFVSGAPTFLPRDPTSRILKQGDPLFVDGGCTYKGYWSDFGRGAVVGPATEKQRRTYESIHEITMRSIDAVKPGIKPEELVRFCEKELQRAGMLHIGASVGRIGHGVGLKIAEPPSIADYDKTTIEPGMVLALEPGTVTEYGMFIVEEDFVVKTDRCEVLSTASRELHII